MCMPIFPVEKARKPPEPNEWHFVQDLQAVNAAVKQRVPDIPNAYTILSAPQQQMVLCS